MSKDVIKTAVIGVGHLGQHHARIINEIEGAELIGVVDVDEKTGRTVAERLGVPYFKNYKEITPFPDAVSIVVPTFLHYEVAKYFLEADTHIFIEKPITKTLREANEILEIAGAKNLTLQVGHVERFNAAMMKLRTISEKPLFIECQRLGPFSPRVQDVGVILDLMIHDIDIVLSLVKSPIKRIDAVGIPILTENEDIANAHLVFENGCIANLTSSRVSSDKVRKLRVFEKDKYFSLDYAEQTISIRRKSAQDETILCEELEIQKAEPLKLELEHFIECIKSRKKPLVTIEDGKNALEVALEILSQVKAATY